MLFVFPTLKIILDLPKVKVQFCGVYGERVNRIICLEQNCLCTYFVSKVWAKRVCSLSVNVCRGRGPTVMSRDDKQDLLDCTKVIPPSTVAIIMDGNGRWGLKKKKSRNFGHKKGTEVVEKIIEVSIKEKIRFLTLYTFSTENWKRPKKEILFLINLLSVYLNKNLEKLICKNIKIKIIGDIKRLPKNLKEKLNYFQKKTKKNDLIQVNVALNYGFKDEIIRAFNLVKKKSLKITKQNISKNLYTHGIPDPDLLIRTGNTRRLSNFLLWQLAYSEIFFENKLWPDFNKRDYTKILSEFGRIKRNFGNI